MQDLAKGILEEQYKGTFLYYLGQAGFIVSSRAGTLLAIDLYLSDCCERIYGFKRLMPKILQPEEIVFDAIAVSHSHEDHFDIDAIPTLLNNCTTSLFVTERCLTEISNMGIGRERLSVISQGDTFYCGGIELRAVFCDHGESAPDAVGFVVYVDGKIIYFTGDTCLRPEMIPHQIFEKQIDVLICPINGKFGNMNEKEAAILTSKIRPKLVIPCHYWNFAEHGGDPGLFANEVTNSLPAQKYLTMAMGECLQL